MCSKRARALTFENLCLQGLDDGARVVGVVGVCAQHGIYEGHVLPLTAALQDIISYMLQTHTRTHTQCLREAHGFRDSRVRRNLVEKGDLI